MENEKWVMPTHIVAKLAVPITELIFVGDEEKDRKTAFNANCKFIWIQRNGKSEESIESREKILCFLICGITLLMNIMAIRLIL